jgi:hypothetical protein
MKVTVKGFVFWNKGYQEGGVFELLPWDCRKWGETNNDGRVFVKEHTTEIEVPDDFDPRPQQVAALEAEKQKARADFQRRVTEIDRQIQSLLAIEHEVPT